MNTFGCKCIKTKYFRVNDFFYVIDNCKNIKIIHINQIARADNNILKYVWQVSRLNLHILHILQIYYIYYRYLFIDIRFNHTKSCQEPMRKLIKMAKIIEISIKKINRNFALLTDKGRSQKFSMNLADNYSTFYKITLVLYH